MANDTTARRYRRLKWMPAAFLQSVRSRLENLSPEDFIDHSEVITAAAVAR
jgi:hypothetical protein